MSDLLREYLGKTIEIWSQGGQSTSKDSGTLVAYDDKWVKIQKSAGFGEETLLFPIANIRLLKPIV